MLSVSSPLYLRTRSNLPLAMLTFLTLSLSSFLLHSSDFCSFTICASSSLALLASSLSHISLSSTCFLLSCHRWGHPSNHGHPFSTRPSFCSYYIFLFTFHNSHFLTFLLFHFSHSFIFSSPVITVSVGLVVS